MMRKILAALFITMLICFTTAAAVDITVFPVEQIEEDGTTRWGYMNESGEQVIGFFYAEANVFDESGYALVKTVNRKVNIIDLAGKTIISSDEVPQQIEYGQAHIVLRFPDYSEYYTYSGELSGRYEGAQGFFADGLLRVKRDELWGYVDEADEIMIAPEFRQASDFADGTAVVQSADGTYGLLTTEGLYTPLADDAAYTEIYEGGLLIVKADDLYYVYSIALSGYISEGYSYIGPYADGYALITADDGLWGIINASGALTLPASYYHLSYMGESVFAARNSDGSAVVITPGGTRVYFSPSSIGTFPPFQYGMSWHSTMSGSIMFFSKNGTFSRNIASSEKAQIVSAGVASITINGTKQYVRFSDGETLYIPTRSYSMNGGVSVSTKQYTNYLGSLPDGTEYGWNLTYPQFSGMANEAVQEKINQTIENFFLNGPYVEASSQPIEGSYGFSQYGSVLVVYADAVVGMGTGASIWNESIMLDMRTGDSYSVTKDLFVSGYESVLEEYFTETPYYQYGYPRVTASSIVFYRNYPQTETRDAYSDAVTLYYTQIWSAINTEGDFYRALNTTFSAGTGSTTRFSDVPAAHWAYEFIEQAAQSGYMTGAGGSFRPDSAILLSEAAAVFARVLDLPAGTMPGVSGVWYAEEYGAMFTAGHLYGLEYHNPEENLTRADAMQMLANAHRGANRTPLTEAEILEALSGFSDFSEIPADRVEAAAYCVSRELIQGANGALNPQSNVTRAEFSKIILSLHATE